MKRPPLSLRRRAAITVGGILALAALFAVLVAVAMYEAALTRIANDRSTASHAYFVDKLRMVELAWDENLMREKSRLEFSRLLEDPTTRWDRLRAYLASLSTAPMYAGLALSAADGHELFRHGPALADRWPALDTRGDRRSIAYATDAQGRLHGIFSTPVWLGTDGMGTMHLLVPLDNAFLRQNAFPGTELFIEWQGRIIAGSEGEARMEAGRPAFEGTLMRDGRRFEQRRVAFPPGSTVPPNLLIQTHIAPPFSVAESFGMGLGFFAMLSGLLAAALHGWFVHLVPRIEKLGRAALLFADDGKPTPALDGLLDAAADAGTDVGTDEIGQAAHAMKDMVSVISLRERQRRSAEERLRESEQRFRDIAESAGEFIWEVDAGQRYVYLSEKAADIFGRPLEQLVGSSVYSHVPPEDIPSLRQRITELGSRGEPFRRFELRILRPDGQRRWISFTGTVIHGDDGQQSGTYRGTAEDVTRQKRDSEKLLLSEKVYANSAQAILVTDPDANIISVNPAFSAITGYAPEDVIGRNPRVFASGRHDKAFYAALWDELTQRGSWSGEIWDRRRNGDVYPKWMSINAVRDPDTGRLSHYVAIFSDITERKENEARIEHLAYHDPLTALPNRYALQARLVQSLADARRNAERVAVMFIDLDRFKTINDSLGHDVGDQLLIAVSRRIRTALRETDTVARLGGDEFVIVVPGIGAPEDAARVAEKVIDHIGKPIALAGHALHTSPSIGISLFPEDGEDSDTLMKNADTAMYFAKQHGRNAYHFFAADMNAAATERLLVETQLRAAIESGEMRLVYQPQVDLANGEVVGVEALLRWDHPERGAVPPSAFIPLAEETGLIVPIGRWVLEAACREAAGWEKAGLPPLRVAVNLSARQFRDHQLVRQVAETLERTGLPAGRLEVEITESAVMDNAERAADILRALRETGIQVAIDDFGTGYSSLAYLKRFPVNRLKIDRSFVMDLEHDANDVAIAHGIIALARTLGLSVIAEGIETPAQLAMLKTFGCAEGQGYLFSRPLERDALLGFLRPSAASGSSARSARPHLH